MSNTCFRLLVLEPIPKISSSNHWFGSLSSIQSPVNTSPSNFGCLLVFETCHHIVREKRSTLMGCVVLWASFPPSIPERSLVLQCVLRSGTHVGDYGVSQLPLLLKDIKLWIPLSRLPVHISLGSSASKELSWPGTLCFPRFLSSVAIFTSIASIAHLH